jgi:hypothetical protein
MSKTEIVPAESIRQTRNRRRTELTDRFRFLTFAAIRDFMNIDRKSDRGQSRGGKPLSFP